MVNFAYIHRRWTRTSERICPVKFETRTKASIINDYSGNRKFATRISENYCLRLDKRIDRCTCVECNLKKIPRTLMPDEREISNKRFSPFRFLSFHCSSNSIKLWNGCNSFIQSRNCCNFIKLVKKNISKYIG